MGRKKKVSVNKVVTTRSKRQANKNCESSNNVDNNSLDSDNTVTQQDTYTENDSQDSNTPCEVATPLHKNFGKYRCLLGNDKNLGPSGNDSEICFESDSNSPTYIKSQHKELKTFKKPEVNSRHDNNKPLIIENHYSTSNLSDSDDKINLSCCDFDTQIPDPTLNLISKCDPRCGSGESLMSASSVLPDCTMEVEHIADDEMITVFEIIDDNGTDDMFYEMKMQHTNYNEHNNQYTDDIESPHIISFKETESINNCAPPEYIQSMSDFENRLNNIDISSGDSSVVDIVNKNVCDNSDKSFYNQVTIPNDIPQQSSDESNSCSDSKSKCSSKSSPQKDVDDSPVVIRRSSRIKTITDLKQKAKGRGLVKTSLKKCETPLVKEVLVKVSESVSESLKLSSDNDSSSPSQSGPFPPPSTESDMKPVKVKSRWRRSSEMEMGSHSPITPPLHSPTTNTNGARLPSIEESPLQHTPLPHHMASPLLDFDDATTNRLKQFQTIYENEYHCDRAISKEAKKMTCDCFLTKEEIERGELGCGDDCLNRLLMIECNSRCPVGDRCTNRRFQNRQYSNLKVIKTEKKGLGLQAVTYIHGGEFLMEYVGEVLNSKQFNQKAEEYSSSDKNVHHYFMALKGDAVIDATIKGNISRFINHSCDPNSETQKWTVNGELRIGFFSKRDILPGEEITFDYQFQRYGKEAQKCYCEAKNCRGWIGEEPWSDEEEEEEEEEAVPEVKEVLPQIKTEDEQVKGDIIEVVKEEIKAEDISDDIVVESIIPLVPHRKKDKPKKIARVAKELLEDVDLEEDMEMLSKSGIKNQSHTLSLCRAMVRAKRTSARTTLLGLLAKADLPCRRLFLDYRGLKLLAPWCQDASASFRLNILIALDKLPIPNKTILQECNLFVYLEKWLSSASPIDSPQDDSDNSYCGTPTLIDDATGLPLELPSKFNQNVQATLQNIVSNNQTTLISNKQTDFYDSEEQKQEIANLCKTLLDRWSLLKEVFRIPKKERIEIMKEHERQANEPHNKKEEKEPRVRKSRWEERYARPERTLDKKKVRPPSPDKLRKLDDRSPLSKEERRREFAERAAREEQIRKATPLMEDMKKPPLLPFPSTPPTWMPPPDYGCHPFGPMAMPNIPPPEYLLPPGYMPMEYLQQKSFMIPYCGPPQPMYMPPQGYPMPTFPPPPPACPKYPMAPPPPCMMPPQPLPFPHNMHPTPPTPCVPKPHTPPPLNNYIPTEPPNPHVNYPNQTLQTTENSSAYLELGGNALTPTDEKQEVEVEEVRLPPHWRSARDGKDRTYYYHVRLRVPQWEPPLYSPTPHHKHEESSSSSDESSESEECRESVRETENSTANEKLVEGVNGIYKVNKTLNGMDMSAKKPKKSRPGLVTGCWIISPRKEEDRIANQIELRRYKENKEKLRRRKEQALLAAAETEALIKFRKKIKDKHKKISKKKKESELVAEEAAKRRKEIFRVNMAKVMVQHLNPFRRDDCPIGKITTTTDFKYLARKLTHFVMLKELKHCKDVNELECNDSVKQKAKEFVKKYMAKFGAVYQRPPDEMD